MIFGDRHAGRALNDWNAVSDAAILSAGKAGAPGQTLIPSSIRLGRLFLDRPAAIDLELHVNEAPRQKSNTKYLIYDVPRLIEYASSFYTLHPGDLIYTGTPGGVGPVKAGDRIDTEIQGIGRMTVRVRNA